MYKEWKPFCLIILLICGCYMEYDDDKERLIRLSSGDHEAFRILFTRYQPGLKKYIAFHLLLGIYILNYTTHPPCCFHGIGKYNKKI